MDSPLSHAPPQGITTREETRMHVNRLVIFCLGSVCWGVVSLLRSLPKNTLVQNCSWRAFWQHTPLPKSPPVSVGRDMKANIIQPALKYLGLFFGPFCFCVFGPLCPTSLSLALFPRFRKGAPEKRKGVCVCGFGPFFSQVVPCKACFSHFEKAVGFARAPPRSVRMLRRPQPLTTGGAKTLTQAVFLACLKYFELCFYRVCLRSVCQFLVGRFSASLQ